MEVTMKRLSCFILPFLMLLSFFLAGCTSSSSSDGGGDVEFEDLIGNYTLKSFVITWADGSKTTPEDVISFSGTMTITSSGYTTQDVEVNGNYVSVSGQIESVSGNTMQINLDGCIANLKITFDGTTFKTIFAKGTCGSDYAETDVWTKVSGASLSPYESNQQIEIDNDELQAGFGSVAATLYEYLP
jgi:hypothetical protein